MNAVATPPAPSFGQPPRHSLRHRRVRITLMTLGALVGLAIMAAVVL
jgi:hypothetical protein